MRQIFNAYPWVHFEEPPELVALYHRVGTFMRVRKGAPLKQGGMEPRLFYLVRGLCAYYVAGDVCGHPTILSLILPGRTMGDITVSTSDRVNVLSKALEDSEVVQVPPGAVTQAILDDPKLGILVTKHLIRKQESHLEGMIANFTLEPAMRLKVLMKVLLLAHHRTVVDDGWNELPLRLNNEQYGAIVNLTRVSVSRILSDWHDKGLLEKDRQKISVRGELFADIYDWKSENTGYPAHRPVWPQPA